MINLMPDDIKKEITYGKRNRILVGWIAAVFVIVIVIGAMAVFGEVYIKKNASNIQSVTKLTEQRIISQNLASTQKDVESLSNNLKTVTQLLGKQLLFSKLFVKIGSIMPNNAILGGITLSNEDQAIDLNVAATDRDAATQSFINISDPKNGLFDKADLVSVNCGNESASSSMTSKYPCLASIKVVMKANSNYYFLNSVINGGS